MSADFLNRFMRAAWPFAAALLENEIIHQAKVKANEKDLDLHVWETTLDLRKTPKFYLPASGLKLRFPGEGVYHFAGRVEKSIPYFPNPEISVYLSIWAEMIFGSGDPVLDIHVEAEGDWAGDIVDWLNGWEGDLEEQIQKSFAEHLGFFRSARYDPSVIVADSEPELLHGYPELEQSKAIDIVLISDGFTVGNMDDFSFIADAFKNKLTTFASSRVNEPFLSFDSVIRIWKLRLPSTNPANVLHRVVSHYHDVGSNSDKTAFANLAQLAAIGPKAEAVGMDVMVFMSDRVTIGGDPRALAMGNLVMLPVSKASANQDASTLIHELGHTLLGGLRDEYIRNQEEYRGNEPKAPNITGQRPNTSGTLPAKWSRWALNPGKLPAWDHNLIKSVEGAGEYKLRLWRPAEICKMKDSSGEVAFCAVCREALTQGIRRILGKESFLVQIMNMTTNINLRVQIKQEQGFNYRVRVPEQGETQFYIKFLASSLPKPWRITFRTMSGINVAIIDEDECFITTSFGDCLMIVVESLCPFVPWNNLQYRTIEVHFDLPLRQIPQAAPTVPVSLTATGSPNRIGQAVLKTLSAISSDPNADEVRFEFEMIDHFEEFTGNNTFFSDWLSWTQENPNVRGHIKKRVGPGGYKFRARAEDKIGQFSNWSGPKSFIVPAQAPS